MTDILERLRDNDTDWRPSDIQDQRRLAADEIERLRAVARDNQKLAAARGVEIERLRALLHRHQIAAWHEDDSDLAVETRAALEPRT